jgi:hypothetical protein
MTLHVLLSLMGTLLLLSGLEWALHRYLMHRRWLGDFTHSRYFKRQYADHAIWHHHRYYRIFDDEPDEIGKWHNLDVSILSGLLAAGPFAVGIYFVDPLTAYMIGVAGILHPVVWSAFHREMHVPTGVWWSRNFMFRAVRYHHLLHHVHPTKNFGALLPFIFDRIFRTQVKPTAADHAKLRSCLRYDPSMYVGPLESWLRDRWRRAVNHS